MKFIVLMQMTLYRGFSGNGLRMILLLCDKEMRAKQLSEIIKWGRGNTSRIPKKLTECGVVNRRISEYGTFYSTNWKAPDVPEQITMLF